MRKIRLSVVIPWLVAGLLALGLAWLFHGFTKYRVENPPSVPKTSLTSAGSGLIADLRFEEADGIVARDSSPLGNLGTLGRFLGYPWFGLPQRVDGVKGRALQFGGRNWVSVANSADTSAETFTVTVWVWQEPGEIRLSDKFVPTIAAKSRWPINGWWLCTDVNSRFIDMGILHDQGFEHVKSGYELPPGEWHHLAVTMDNLKHEVAFYVDGKMFGPLHTQVKTWLTNHDLDLYIADYDGTAKWPWKGKIDDFRFYNTILTAEQVAAVYRGD